MDQSKTKGKTASTFEFIFGALFLLFGAKAMSMNGMLLGMGAWNCLAWILLGACLIVSGLEWRILIRDYKTYSTLIANDSASSIAKISRATKTPEKVVRDNLKLMIKKGLAVDTVINEQDGTIVVGGRKVGAPDPSTIVASAAAAPQNVTVSCSGCGARNTIARGSSAVCEHCGAPISA